MRARENPFAVEHILRLGYRLPTGSWSDFLAHLASQHFRGAIIGHEGTGKTTFLEALSEKLRERDWDVRMLKLTRDEPVFDPRRLRRALTGLSTRHFVLLDGAEQLNRWRWRGFVAQARDAGGLIVTTHRAGRLPTVFECRSSLALTQALVAELWGAEDPAVATLVEQLFAAHAGNVRDVLRALYDSCARGELVHHCA